MSASGCWSIAFPTASGATPTSVTSSSFIRRRGPRPRRAGSSAPSASPDSRARSPTPEKADTNFIKRVVGLPGDRLKILNGIPIVNGEPVTGDWEIRPCRGVGGCDFPNEITIPPDHYFMMGDNRGASDDSRYWGPVPRDWLIGTAFATYWPPDRIGLF